MFIQVDMHCKLLIMAYFGADGNRAHTHLHLEGTITDLVRVFRLLELGSSIKLARDEFVWLLAQPFRKLACGAYCTADRRPSLHDRPLSPDWLES